MSAVVWPHEACSFALQTTGWWLCNDQAKGGLSLKDQQIPVVDIGGQKKKVANTEVGRIRVEKHEIKSKGKYGQGTAYDSGLSHIEITLLY